MTHSGYYIPTTIASFVFFFRFHNVVFFFHLALRRHLISSLCVSPKLLRKLKRDDRNWIGQSIETTFDFGLTTKMKKKRNQNTTKEKFNRWFLFRLGFAYWMMDFDYGFQWRVCCTPTFIDLIEIWLLSCYWTEITAIVFKIAWLRNGKENGFQCENIDGQQQAKVLIVVVI